jgi:hypothetical protein
MPPYPHNPTAGLGVEHDLYALTVGFLPLPLLLTGAQALTALVDRLHDGAPRAVHLPLQPPPAQAHAQAEVQAQEAAAVAAVPHPELQPPHEQEQEQEQEPGQGADVAAAAAAAAAADDQQAPLLPPAPAPAPAAAAPPDNERAWRRQLRPLARRTGEVAVLLVLWLGLAPLLLGLLFELAVGVPARVPAEAVPVLPMFEGACVRACLRACILACMRVRIQVRGASYHPRRCAALARSRARGTHRTYHPNHPNHPTNQPTTTPPPAWALGLVLLKLWVRCCLLGVLGADDPWKRRLERVRARGLRRLDFHATLHDVVRPLIISLLLLLAVPFLLTTTLEALAAAAIRVAEARLPPPPPARFPLPLSLRLLPALDTLSLAGGGVGGPTSTASAAASASARRLAAFSRRRHLVLRAVAGAKKWGYLACLCLRLLLAAAAWLRRAARRLHDALRDERYLVGMELQNRQQQEGGMVVGPVPAARGVGEGQRD